MLLLAFIASLLSVEESIFYVPPFSSIDKSSIPIINPIELTINKELHFNASQSNLIHIQGFDLSSSYNSRVSWSSLDPIELETFKLLKIQDDIYLDLQINSIYDKFNNTEVIILTEDLILDLIPKSLFGVLLIIISSCLFGGIISYFMYNFIKSI